MRIELDLTRAEMMAFGFAVGAGMLRLDVTEDPEALERALFDLHEKVVRATQRAFSGEAGLGHGDASG